MAAAWGAAAEVPKNGEKFSGDGDVTEAVSEVETPSAAVMSGFCRITPPVCKKLFAVIGVPSWR